MMRGTQQTDDVRADAEAEALVDLFGHGGAADAVAALEHEHVLAGASEIRRAHQAVVPAADDDGVVGLGHR